MFGSARLFVLCLSLVVASIAQAQMVPARISNFTCTGSHPSMGGLQIVYTGLTFNVAESTSWIPTLQQGTILGVESRMGLDLVVRLRGTTNQATYALRVMNGTGVGFVRTAKGTMQMICTGDIGQI